MANSENLIPFSKETAAKAGRIGGVKSGSSRRRRKELLSLVNEIMESSPKNSDIKNMAGYLGESEPTNLALMIVSLVESAKRGNTRAASEIISLVEKSEAKAAAKKETEEDDSQIRIVVPWNGRGNDLAWYVEYRNTGAEDVIKSVLGNENLKKSEMELLEKLEEKVNNDPKKTLDTIIEECDWDERHLISYLLPYMEENEISRVIKLLEP